MKKGQILAALALAFALGVVAPTAGTYAAYGGTSAEVTASKASVAEVTKKYTAVPYVNEYGALIGVVNAANDAVKAKLDDRLGDLQTALANVADLSFVPANYTSYDALLGAAKADEAAQTAIINTQNAVLATATPGSEEATNANSAISAAQLIINNIEQALTAAETTTGIAAVYNTQAGDLVSAMRTSGLFDLSGIKPSDNGKYTEADYNNIYNLATSGKYNQYVALWNAINKISAIKDESAGAEIYGPQAVANAIANVEAAINAINNNTVTPNPEPVNPETPTTPSEDGKGGDADKVGTPNDGALASAEGSASASASIMAAIATTVTAAGAAFIAIRRKIAAKKEA